LHRAKYDGPSFFTLLQDQAVALLRTLSNGPICRPH
jgi:hypothetical protein